MLDKVGGGVYNGNKNKYIAYSSIIVFNTSHFLLLTAAKICIYEEKSLYK